MSGIAAERTQEVPGEPQPFILSVKLEAFAATYELNVYIFGPHGMARINADLHRQILDVFNEYGAQIMTPAYEGDPDEPKAHLLHRAVGEREEAVEDGAGPRARVQVRNARTHTLTQRRSDRRDADHTH